MKNTRGKPSAGGRQPPLRLNYTLVASFFLNVGVPIANIVTFVKIAQFCAITMHSKQKIQDGYISFHVLINDLITRLT